MESGAKLALELVTHSMDQNFRYMESAYEAEKKRADELEAELNEIRPYARKWWKLVGLLQEDITL